MKTIWRSRFLISIGIFFLTLLFVAHPHPASAQFSNGFDPAGDVVNFTQTNQWLTKAQGWARQIYLGLIIFEVIALGVTTLLFRENLGEFFASVGLKIVLGSVFFWFISVAGPGISQLPGQVMQTFGTTFGKGMGGTDDVNGLAAEGLAASAIYFGASYAMREEDGALASALEQLPPTNCSVHLAAGYGYGFCYEQPSETVAFVRQTAELLVSSLGVMVGMAMAAIYLQFTLITIESYIVMTAGTLFIGFAGSRFTMPFSQGYFSYMISVGVKLMALYLVLGIVGPLLDTILESAVGTLISSLLDPTGFAALAAAVFGVLSVVVGAGIVAMVPGFAASFISGQSFASGASALQQAASTVSGSAQMMAQLSASNSSRREANREQQNAQAVMATQAAYNRDTATMSPATANGQSFSPAADQREGGPISVGVGAGANGQSVLGDTLGLDRQNPQVIHHHETVRLDAERETAGTDTNVNGQTPDAPAQLADRRVWTYDQGSTASNDRDTFAPRLASSREESLPVAAQFGRQGVEDSDGSSEPLLRDPNTGQNLNPGGRDTNRDRPLDGASVNDLAKLSRNEILARLPSSSWQKLDYDAQQWLIGEGYGDAAISGYSERAQRANVDAELIEGMALSGLAQTGIRDVGPPTAAQVRFSAPDRL